MSQATRTAALPSAVKQKLQSLRWRRAALVATRAILFAVAVLILAMITAMAVDWSLTLFSTSLRTMLTVAAVFLATGALVLTGLPALRAAMRWSNAATYAEDAVPQLEERWTTLASMAESKSQPDSPTGQAMLQQVNYEAAAMGQLVEPRRIAKVRSLRFAGHSLLMSLLLLSGFLALDWPQTSVLLQRFWSPTAHITATKLESVTGNVRIPRSESLNLVTELSGLPRQSAILTLVDNSGLQEQMELKPDQERPTAFIHSLRPRNSFRYQVRAGDGRTAWHTVSVVDYPELEEIRFTVNPPEYVNRPPYEKSLLPSRIQVLEGSHLQLSMKAAQPLKRFLMEFAIENDHEEAKQEVIELTPDDNGWYYYEMPLVKDFSLSPKLLSHHGLANEHPPRCHVRVISDKAPIAKIISSDKEKTVAPDDKIGIAFEAHDDHGIATAELVVYTESPSGNNETPEILKVQKISLGEQELQKHIKGEASLDLKSLNLPEETRISYAIRVTDNRNLEVTPNQKEMVSHNSRADRSEANRQRQPDPTKEPSVNQTWKSRKRADNLTKMLADAGQQTEAQETQSKSSGETLGKQNSATSESQKANSQFSKDHSGRRPPGSTDNADQESKEESAPTAESPLTSKHSTAWKAVAFGSD